MKPRPIKLRRIRVGFPNRKEAANLLSISERYLEYLECGAKTPSAQLIARMARVYRCTTDEIFKDFNITGE